jgi:hypothetical protein
MAVQSASVPTVWTSRNRDCVATCPAMMLRPRNAPHARAAPPRIRRAAGARPSPRTSSELSRP